MFIKILKNTVYGKIKEFYILFVIRGIFDKYVKLLEQVAQVEILKKICMNICQEVY